MDTVILKVMIHINLFEANIIKNAIPYWEKKIHITMKQIYDNSNYTIEWYTTIYIPLQVQVYIKKLMLLLICLPIRESI